MKNQLPSPRRGLVAAHRLLKRTAVFSGGAIAGSVVSAAAGYVLVSALFPQPQAPAHAPALTAALIADAPVDATPASPDLPRLALAPAPEALTAPAEAPVAAPADILVSAPATARPAPAPAPAMEDALVVASKAQPDIALPTQPPAPVAMIRAEPFEPASESGSPMAFAALAAADALVRDGASLGLSATIRPQPRPEAMAAVAATDTAVPGIAPIRPRPRPEGLILAAAEALPDTIPALRPRPRPAQLETRHLAAATPAPEAAPVPRRASGGLFSGGGTCGSSLARAIPNRSGNAPGGQQFLASLGTSGSGRDQQIINELARGNMPGFLRDLQPVAFRGTDARGADTEIVVCVTPDYLALGSDRDYVRVPLGLPAAASIANRFDMTLPTPRMVDAIYAQASVRLSPSPMTPGPQMSSTDYFLRHNATIEGQLRGRGGLVAGQKKDVVMASRMANAPGRVAIYGWHRSSGSPIQPVSTVHGANYADYSHGIRLVSKTAYLDGKAVNLDDLLASGRYAWLLNEEGPVPGPVIRIASR